ncbi:DEAD/DEAH box helicase [Paenibacillus validus]|uniref:DEAD/DEAH box helicase n=1 Tax=Paenibacillus validus TaxID=44253 RepID=UPI000FDB4C7C|nr:DEAD/DEAH box helicase [Paenibacillus validus]MED4600211.1 DEAD/DEAH box helicase [Paenibacillus validus]MED4605212.1 DEAD/DEAH box helicase [Paenibacillus validus]
MIDYAPGMRVIIRDEEWMIKKVETNSLDRKTIYCVGISKLVKDKEAIFLTDIETIEQVDPAKTRLVVDDSPFFKKSRLFVESKWRQKIPTNSMLHVGGKAAMDLMNFQLEPAQVALRRPRQRVLIADTVGLGKTLEAGILMAELIARGKGKRILVVTVKSMMTQFQKELWNRFTIPLVRLDSNHIAKIRSELPSNYNPFFYYDKTIVSIDTLKRDLEYRTHLENAWWDIIVIDEAHNVAERGGRQAQRAKLAKLLSERSDTLIMLSATPHDGRSESFASLMNMLDPTAIANPHDYSKEDIKGLCIRRFKKDVKDQIKGSFKERKVSIEKCDASPEEESAFQVFAEMQLEMDTTSTRIAGQLFKTSLEKAMFSSPAACIKSIDERLKKLHKKYGASPIGDIAKLEKLKSALLRIEPSSFSRYQKLLDLLQDKNYGWNVKRKDDRIVIFTERIETMRYLAAQLRKDLGLNENIIKEMYGGMSDADQQKIVEDFGREESPIRILVASDVASEGINLHYLSHRLIHFDIPWSLMVFQQRNGRIDRYGQKEQPDIRYFLINSKNEKIRGDMRIMEILVAKEEQAYKNIGDPTLLMGTFNVEEEELITATAIEQGISADEFSKQIDETADDFDPFELLMQGASSDEEPPTVVNEETLYGDKDYLQNALLYFSQTEQNPVQELQTVTGLEITVTPELNRRLKAVLPVEALPKADFMRLSPDKQFCMDEMKRSMQNNMEDTAWPQTQYLWPLHPIFEWVNDKAGLLYGRGEAPIVGLSGKLSENEFLYIVAGTIPNRKSTPVVDEWFGLRYVDGRFTEELTMEQLIAMSGFGRSDTPNRNRLSEASRETAQALLPSVVFQAQKVLKRYSEEYRNRINPEISAEIDKLSALEERHKDYQLSLFEDDRRKSAKEREVERIFNEFTEWVRDTLEIKDNPYLRIIAVLTGVN